VYASPLIVTVACNSLWPEYEITCEDESEVDTSIFEADGNSNSLITRQQMDETVESLIDNFEVVMYITISRGKLGLFPGYLYD